MISYSLDIDDQIKNSSSDVSQNAESEMIVTPPCQDIESESVEIQNCCNVFTMIYKNTNVKQIMALMKYSMEISNPWISQYYYKNKEKDLENNEYGSRHLSKGWFSQNKDSLLKLFSRELDLDFLQKFG